MGDRARVREGEGGNALPTMVCVCASLRRAARAVTQSYEAELKHVGLSSPQFTILYVLSQFGEMPQHGLSDFLATDSTTLTRTLKLMAGKGWISSRPGEEDTRLRLWTLTAQGKTRLQRGTPHWQSAQGRLKGRVGEKEWSRLLEDLAKIAGLVRTA